MDTFSPVEQTFQVLSNQLAAIDAHAADQMAELGEAIAAGDASDWLGIDLMTAFDVPHLVSRIEASKFRFRQLLQWLEVSRNFLVLLPVTLTWAGLWAASLNYRAAISPPNPPSQEPFLLLWERGFDGLGVIDPPLVHTFSQLASLDALILLLLIIITVVLYGWRTVEEARASRISEGFRVELNRSLRQASLWLARKRHQRTEMPFAQFHVQAEALVQHIEQEQQRANAFVDRREQEAIKLATFASDLIQGTQELPSFARQIRDLYQAFDTSVNRLGSQVNEIGQNQGLLTNALNATNDRLQELTVRLTAIQHETSQATATLRSASERNAESAREAAHVAVSLADVGHKLVDDRAALQSSIEQEHVIYSGVTRELHGASASVHAVATQLSASLERLAIIGDQMKVVMHLSAQITDDFNWRDSQEQNLAATLEQIAGRIHEAVKQLVVHDESTRRLLERLETEGQNISERWNQGHQAWLQQVEESGRRVAGTFATQNMELVQAGKAVQEGIRRLESEHMKMRDLMTKQSELLHTQSSFHTSSLEVASKSLTTGLLELSQYYGQMNRLVDRLVNSVDGKQQTHLPGAPTDIQTLISSERSNPEKL